MLRIWEVVASSYTPSSPPPKNVERVIYEYVLVPVSTRIRKIPVQEIFREMAPIPGNVRTYPKVCVGKRLENR